VKRLLQGKRARAFVDVEASGLGAKSWPVEVGWAFACGKARSFLIRPDPGWDPQAWDPRAENLHGISRALLLEKGAAVGEVCEAVNDALGGSDVYSDAPDWDGFWLSRLFTTAQVKPAFLLRDFGRLFRDLAGEAQDTMIARAERIAPRLHRAGADARHLQALYRLSTTARAKRRRSRARS
jgi:hypothetical protein